MCLKLNRVGSAFIKVTSIIQEELVGENIPVLYKEYFEVELRYQKLAKYPASRSILHVTLTCKGAAEPQKIGR